MKEKYFFLVLLISFLPLISIFSTSLFLHTHDGLVHLPRIAAYFKALQDGQLPVRWAGDLNYGYGMPLFNFIYQLPYFIASVFLFLGFSLVNSFKITLALSYLLSGIFMFGFGKAFFEDTKKAFLVTVFYQFAPFRLVEILVRGSLGEVYTYTFLPLVLLGLTLLSRKQKYPYFFLSSIASALLVLSHNALSLVFFGISCLFIIFFMDKKKMLYCFLSLITGLLLASFYWVPAVFEHKYTYGDLFMREMYLSHFPPLLNFFIPNFTNNQRLQTGGISVQFGLFHTIALLLCVKLLFRKKLDLIYRKTILFCLFLIFGALFLMQPLSKIIWEHISFLRQFQFPWRFLAVTSFATAFLSIGFFSYSFFKKQWVYILVITGVIFSTIYYWNPPLGYDKIGVAEERYYWNFPLNTTYFGETDLIWSAGPAKKYPKNRVDVIGGKATVSNFTRNSYQQHFAILAQTPATFVDHTQYFPGWQIFVDGKQTQISFQDQSWRGEIIFSLPKGKHTVEAIFKESRFRFIFDIVSVSSFTFLLFGFVFFRKKTI